MHFLNDTYKIKIIFLSLWFSCSFANAAILPDSLTQSSAIVRSFEPNKIINTSPNYSMVFDASGIMFLGQEDMISIFNGFSWSYVHAKGKILLSRNSLNTIFYSGENTLGYLSPDSSLNFEPVSLYDILPEKLKPFSQVIDIKSAGKTVYIQSGTFLFSFGSGGFKILEEDFGGGKIFACREKLLAVKPGNRVDVFQDNQLENSLFFEGEPVQQILEHDSGYLVVAGDRTCLVTNESFGILLKWMPGKIQKVIHCRYLGANDYLFSDGSSDLQIYSGEGKIKTGFPGKFEIPRAGIVDIVLEPSGNLWILQDKLISRIEYPSAISIISAFPNSKGFIRDIRAYENKIYIAGTNGLYYQSSPGNDFISTPVADFCYRLIPTPNGLLAISNDLIYLLNGDQCETVFNGKMLDQSWNPVSQKLYISESNSIVALSFFGNHLLNFQKFISPVNPLKILSLGSRLWITNGESLFQYTENGSLMSDPVKIDVPDAAGISELFSWDNKLHILCGENIYSLSEGKIYHERFLTNNLCSAEYLSISEDPSGNLWYLSRDADKNSVIWFGNSAENSVSKIVLPSSISLTNPSIDYIGDQKIIFSAGMQIYLLDISAYSSKTRKFETIVIKIIAGDEVLFKGVSYDLFRVPLRSALNNIPFASNDIRIDLSSTNYVDNRVKYQYLLKTNGKSDLIWSEWNGNPFIELKNLREGQYEISIRSKDYLNETSPPASIIFRILPPFYRTWLAYIFYVLSLGIILFVAYKTYLLNLHRARTIVSLKNSELAASSVIPVNTDGETPSPETKKFDFYSNIDTDSERDKTKWDKFEMVTVLFSDIQGFTKIAESMNPEMLIDELDRFFFHFDSVVEKYNIEKIKTIGDAYMAAGGIPKKSIANPIEVVLAALEMQNYMNQLRKTKIDIWDLRIGIHSGPVIAGVIGHKKRSFDIWGDTVNTASRMETTGEAGKVNISGETYKLVKEFFICEYRGKLPVKYKGNVDMYFVKGLRPELSINLLGQPNRKFFLKLQLLRLADLEEQVLSKLETELDKNLHFHNFEYTRHLYEYSELLSKAAGIDQEDTLLVRTSALLLNVGFTGGYQNQENRSAEFARNILKEFNYSEKQVISVSNLILSTKWPAEPKNELEMIINDIKMEFIGRADYLKLYKLLFLEQNHYLKSVEVQEFKKNQIELIQKYSFYTDSANRLREVEPGEQIARIKDDDWNEPV